MDWVTKSNRRIVKRNTNVFSCTRCGIDHILKGTEIDDSGWETLILPTVSHIDKRTQNPAHRSSAVKTYTDSSLKNEQQPASKKQKNIASPSLASNSVSIQPSPPTNVKGQKGIRVSTSTARRCGECEFHLKNNRCAVHSMYTNTNEVCRRFKNYKLKIYLGGSFSPR